MAPNINIKYVLLACILIRINNTRVLTVVEKKMSGVQFNDDQQQDGNIQLAYPEPQAIDNTQNNNADPQSEQFGEISAHSLLEQILGDSQDNLQSQADYKSTQQQQDQLTNLQFKFMRSFYKVLKLQRSRLISQFNNINRIIKQLKQQNGSSNQLELSLSKLQSLKRRKQKVIVQEDLLQTQLQILNLQDQYLQQLQNNESFINNQSQIYGTNDQNYEERSIKKLRIFKNQSQSNSQKTNPPIKLVGCLEDIDCAGRGTFCKSNFCVYHIFTENDQSS